MFEAFRVKLSYILVTVKILYTTKLKKDIATYKQRKNSRKNEMKRVRERNFFERNSSKFKVHRTTFR